MAVEAAPTLAKSPFGDRLSACAGRLRKGCHDLDRQAEWFMN